jgi:hypothetical protein
MDQQTKTDALEGLQNRIDRRRADVVLELTTVVDGKTHYQRWLDVHVVVGTVEDQVRAYALYLGDEQRAIRDAVKSLNKLGTEPAT